MSKKKILTGSMILVVSLVALSTLFVSACNGASHETIKEKPQETILFPVVDSLDPETVTNDVQKAAETIYQKDFSAAEVHGSWECKDLVRDVIDVSFMGQGEETPYIASVNPETKQIIAMETVADKGDLSANAAHQEDYAAAATNFLLKQFDVADPGALVCRLPAPNGKESDKSVYVFFTECFTYVEISASSDFHPIGYRYFGNAEEMNAFMTAQSHVL